MGTASAEFWSGFFLRCGGNCLRRILEQILFEMWRELLTFLGVMIANLTNLTQLTFDGVDPDAAELERFWAGISASPSLTSLNFAHRNNIVHSHHFSLSHNFSKVVKA